MKNKILMIIILMCFATVTFCLIFKFRNNDTIKNKDKEVEEKSLTKDGVYSYLTKNEDNTYNLVLTADSTDYNDSVAMPYYTSNDYVDTEFNESANSYTIVGPKWYDTSSNYKITKIIIKTKIYPTKAAYWFSEFADVLSIEGLENIDLSKVTNVSGMFSGCKKLTTLDLSGFDMKNITNTSGMFSNCTSLKTIYVDKNKWDLSNVTQSTYMFYNANKIVGSNQTKYDKQHTDKEYARIDSKNKPGYLTQK